MTYLKRWHLLSENVHGRLEETLLTYDAGEMKRAVEELLEDRVGTLTISKLLTELI